jgi:hypothetical protein
MLLVAKKKILFTSLILSLVFVLTGCFGSGGNGDNDVWKSYSNNHYGIKYPKEWKKSSEMIEEGEIDIYFAAGSLFPDFNPSDFKPYLIIDETSYSEPFTNENLDGLRNYILSLYSDAVEVESEQINFNGQYAYEFILSGPIDPYLEENSSFNSKVKIISFAEGNCRYELIYYAMPDNYDSYLGIANEMINSIEIF